ncbi:ATP-binding cassette domain-containing protein [Nocardiopsis metallicus]|uniref:ABC-2 type transport system ATP-binding protein n=1 Tax=Nocardiopsis metallicus TaxID=179819 RepID=A0A840WD21_9ACTN|nr:ATP-binding cassette domain-containing protein [Nocardiopsis metallicus]MBB5494034.1 ABC-2 type transport system ATP-binding protein [Nocardiopsis metallicus]
MAKYTVSVRKLSKSYGTHKVINGLDFDLAMGVTGVLGPNGAGKTTLLRCLATVLRADAGQLDLLGLNPDITSERTRIRRNLGYLPQDPGMYPNFTCQEMLDYIAVLREISNKEEREEAVARALAEVDLSSSAGTKIRKLSGGMRQRLAIAQAFLADPGFVILDEPTVGLDPEQRMRFRTLISQKSEQRTVVLSTHQTDDVAALCSRVLVYRDGRVLFAGTPQELAEHARGRVWVSERPPGRQHAMWRTASGDYRSIGERPPGARAAEPAVEDGYLLLLESAPKAADTENSIGRLR